MKQVEMALNYLSANGPTLASVFKQKLGIGSVNSRLQKEIQSGRVLVDNYLGQRRVFIYSLVECDDLPVARRVVSSKKLKFPAVTPEMNFFVDPFQIRSRQLSAH